MSAAFDCVAAGQQLRAKRLAKGLTQRQVAEISSYDDSTIGYAERGQRTPEYTYQRLNAALDAYHGTLFDPTEEAARKKKIGESLEARRKALKLSRTAAAKRCRMTDGTIKNAEEGTAQDSSIAIIDRTYGRLEDRIAMGLPLVEKPTLQSTARYTPIKDRRGTCPYCGERYEWALIDIDHYKERITICPACRKQVGTWG